MSEKIEKTKTEKAKTKKVKASEKSKVKLNALEQQHQGHLMQIIQRPHISEKSTLVGEKHRQFVFEVTPSATKPEIKQAVELLFEVKVDGVRVCNVKKKERRFKQHIGYRKGWKKAYVSLKEGHDINFMGNK